MHPRRPQGLAWPACMLAEWPSLVPADCAVPLVSGADQTCPSSSVELVRRTTPPPMFHPLPSLPGTCTAKCNEAAVLLAIKNVQCKEAQMLRPYINTVGSFVRSNFARSDCWSPSRSSSSLLLLWCAAAPPFTALTCARVFLFCVPTFKGLERNVLCTPPTCAHRV